MSNVFFARIFNRRPPLDTLLRQIAACPIPAQSVCPHVRAELIEAGLVSVYACRAPAAFRDMDDRKIEHLRITLKGRERIGSAPRGPSPPDRSVSIAA